MLIWTSHIHIYDAWNYFFLHSFIQNKTLQYVYFVVGYRTSSTLIYNEKRNII